MKTITTGQEKQCVRLVTDAAEKAAEEALAELKKNGTLNGDNLQRIIEKGGHVSVEVKNFLMGLLAKLAENIMGCLKLISGAETLTIDACEDSAMTGATDVFDGWIDPDFENYECDGVGQPTSATNVQVHEMIKDGDFKTIYNGMGDNLDLMCLTKGQIKSFVKKYREWLRTDGYGTFFLFKANNRFFVADVHFGSGRLKVYVDHFSDGYVWGAGDRRRFVFPQLNL